MNAVDLKGLVIMTVAAPADAARQVMALCPPRNVLWLAFFLAVILNTLLQTAAGIVFPLINPESNFPVEPVVQTLATSTGALLLSVMAFCFVGRILGGQASLDSVMALIIWLQLLQIGAQGAIYLIALLMPFLFEILVLIMSVYSIYITLHFINQAHQFDSLGKSFLVVLLSGLVAVPIVLLLFPLG